MNKEICLDLLKENLDLYKSILDYKRLIFYILKYDLSKEQIQKYIEILKIDTTF